MDGSSIYYRDSGQIPLASRLSMMARRQMFEQFMKVMNPSAETTILDVGVTCDSSFQESNFFEQLYPFKNRIVCVGTENAQHLEAVYPGITFRQVAQGEPLPFSTGQFDIVFSNAVVEHVGDSASQREFVKQACRVGRRVFITTPNRWFPVEHHTGVPLIHYLPPSMYRGLLKHTSLRYWSDERHLNQMTAGQLGALFPVGCPVTVRRCGVGFGPLRSNLIAFTSRHDR